MQQKIILFTTMIAFLLISGCASTGLKPGQIAVVKRGVVIAMEPVRLAGSSTGAGAAIGGAVGTGIGTSIGGGNVRDIVVGAIIGQVVGMFAGNVAEQKVTESDGFNIAIKLDNGEEVSVAQKIQDAEERGIKVGMRVKVLGSIANATVQPEQDR